MKANGFRWGSRLAFVGAVICLLMAVSGAAIGALALTGKAALPFHGQWGPFSVTQGISWQVSAQPQAFCASGNVSTWHDDECLHLYLRTDETWDAEREAAGEYSHDADVRPVEIRLDGEMVLASTGGWSPLVAHSVATQVAKLLLAAGFLFLLRRVLASAANGDVFTDRATAQVRGMGWVLIAGGVVGVVSSLTSTPSQLGYGYTSFGPAVDYDVGRTGSIDLTLFAVGALVLLLAQVYRRGSELTSETELTI